MEHYDNLEIIQYKTLDYKIKTNLIVITSLISIIYSFQPSAYQNIRSRREANLFSTYNSSINQLISMNTLGFFIKTNDKLTLKKSKTGKVVGLSCLSSLISLTKIHIFKN